MKNREKKIEWNKDTKKMKRPSEQVVISWLRKGYTTATHGYNINKQDNNEYSFCNVRLTVDHNFRGLQRNRGRETKSQNPKQHLGQGKTIFEKQLKK
jgi:hypothetical protein